MKSIGCQRNDELNETKDKGLSAEDMQSDNESEGIECHMNWESSDETIDGCVDNNQDMSESNVCPISGGMDSVVNDCHNNNESHFETNNTSVDENEGNSQVIEDLITNETNEEKSESNESQRESDLN